MQQKQPEMCLMTKLSEGLRKNDLQYLIKPIFDVDVYKSKMGEDSDVAVVTFQITGLDPAIDMINFLEKGFDFVLDASHSSSEDENGNYKVFVEIERSRKIRLQIEEILYGLTELSGIEDWKFRYYKDYHSKTVDELKTIPTSKQEYETRMQGIFENEIRYFFRKSALDLLLIENDILTFKRPFNSPVHMKLIKHGTRTEILNDVAGTIRVDEASTSESLWLTKYFGNYNITKYDNHFVFENENIVMVFDLQR
jgi:hypothetical protein